MGQRSHRSPHWQTYAGLESLHLIFSRLELEEVTALLQVAPYRAERLRVDLVPPEWNSLWVWTCPAAPGGDIEIQLHDLLRTFQARSAQLKRLSEEGVVEVRVGFGAENGQGE